MAVDSKQGVNGSSNGKLLSKAGRKRPSSLMAQASSLPKVEHSLDEFIAKANQTLVDVSNWGAADAEAKAEDDKRREQDALRMRAAETQMKEGEVREQSLRRQLDGLQGKLAEAEARAAVAGSTMGSAAHDQTLAQLRAQIEAAEQQRKSAELKNTQLSTALSDAKNEVAIARASAPAISVPSTSYDDGEAAERVRIAEAKATKAIAAAKAAQAGLTVSSADIAAIESGLVVTNLDQPKGTPWAAIAIAFVGGLGLMLVIWKFVLSKNEEAKPATTAPPAAASPTTPQPAAAQPDPTPATTPAATAPATAPATTPAATAPVAPGKPIVTPIEEEPAKTEPAKTDVKTEPAKAEPVATEPAKTEPAKTEPAKAEPVKAPAKAATKAPTKAATKAPTKAPAKATTTKASKGTIADPFAETPAPKKTTPVKKTTKPTTGGVVDPF